MEMLTPGTLHNFVLRESSVLSLGSCWEEGHPGPGKHMGANTKLPDYSNRKPRVHHTGHLRVAQNPGETGGCF